LVLPLLIFHLHRLEQSNNRAATTAQNGNWQMSNDKWKMNNENDQR
jgi:hypothetical protein